MQNVHVDYRGAALDYQSASFLAKNIALENKMREPTIMSWHKNSNDSMAPYYVGANSDSWWEKYGEGNGGKLGVSVGDEYDFVMMDSRGYETVGQMPLRNLSDASGNQYLCYTPILGRDASQPTAEACIVLDGWLADQY